MTKGYCFFGPAAAAFTFALQERGEGLPEFQYGSTSGQRAMPTDRPPTQSSVQEHKHTHMQIKVRKKKKLLMESDLFKRTHFEFISMCTDIKRELTALYFVINIIISYMYERNYTFF